MGHKEATAAYSEVILSEKEIAGTHVFLQISADIQSYEFAVEESEEQTVIAREVDGSFLGSETAGGYVGAYIGMFASANGEISENYAEFKSFYYEGK